MKGFPRIIEDKFYEGGSPSLLARVLDSTGEAATSASFASCTYSIYDYDDSTPLATGSLTVGTVIEDTLQTGDDRWTEDNVGWNFLWQIPAALLSLADRATYWIEVVFLDSAGARTPVLAKLSQYPLRSI